MADLPQHIIFFYIIIRYALESNGAFFHLQNNAAAFLTDNTQVCIVLETFVTGPWNIFIGMGISKVHKTFQICLCGRTLQ